MNKKIEFIEVMPAITPTHSIIWLHGLGADGNDFAPIAHKLIANYALPTLRFVLPHAPFQPITINNGYVMRAWYDIVSLEVSGHADLAGIKKSVNTVYELIEQEKSFVPTENIILAGFSQGGVIAMATALNYPNRLGGLIALSGYLHIEDCFPASTHPNHDLPIFLGHGTFDEIVPIELGKRAYEILKKHHYPVSWHDYNMAHSVCEEEIKDIAEWLKKLT